jgi:hypothetical protein
LLGVRRIGARGNLSEQPQRPCLVASLLVLAGQCNRTFGGLSSLLGTLD